MVYMHEKPSNSPHTVHELVSQYSHLSAHNLQAIYISSQRRKTPKSLTPRQ